MYYYLYLIIFKYINEYQIYLINNLLKYQVVPNIPI